MASVDQFNVDHLILGLGAGVLLVALCTRPAIRGAFPLLATTAVALLSPRLDVTAAIAAAGAVAALPTGWGTWRMARSGSAPMLALYALITLAGLWAAVPDTEAVIVTFGVVAPAALVAVVRRPTVDDMIGWPLLAVTVVLVAGASSAEEVEVAIGAFGCFVMLAVAPAAALVDRRALEVLDPRLRPGRALVSVLVGAASVAWCARVATDADTAAGAVLLVAASWGLSAVVVVGLALSIRRRSPMS